MKLTLRINERIVGTARKKVEAQGKSLEELISDYLGEFADGDPEQSIAEFKKLSGRGNSAGNELTAKKFTTVRSRVGTKKSDTFLSLT